MNLCFEKFVGFIRIMSDGLDKIVALKKLCNFSNSVKITQSNVFFSYFIKFMNTGVTFNLLIGQKILLWKR